MADDLVGLDITVPELLAKFLEEGILNKETFKYVVYVSSWMYGIDWLSYLL